MTGIVTLTTDFGTGSGYVGAMKGAILSVNPELTVVDLDHEVRPHDVRHGLKEVREITNRKLGRPELSDTFHGRDLFGPVAAHVLSGTKVKDVGAVLRDFVDLDFGTPKKRKGGFEGVVITHDRFGNVVTNIPRSEVEKTWAFGDRLEVTIGGYEMTVPLVATYGIVPARDFLATLSSSGFLEISRRESNAASQLEVVPGMPVTVAKT